MKLLNGIDIFRILSLGSVGFGFFLAVLAFRLLTQEQSIKSPRTKILNAINRFMIFSIALCGMGLGSEIYRSTHKETGESAVKSVGFNNVLGAQPTDLQPLQPGEQAEALKVAEDFWSKYDTKDFKGIYEMGSDLVKNMVPFSMFQTQMKIWSRAYGGATSHAFEESHKCTASVLEQATTLYILKYKVSFELDPNSLTEIWLTRSQVGRLEIYNFKAL